jgi:putative DNA primase/helicase
MSRAKKNGEALTSPTTKNTNSTTIVAQKEAQSLTPKEIDSSSTIISKNIFTSFEEFKSFVKGVQPGYVQNGTRCKVL